MRPAGTVAGLAACLLVAAPGYADDDGRAWLERMSRALTTSSYVGEFVLEGRGYAERMQIFHCVRDGELRERLIAVSGPGRELVRRGDEVTAYLVAHGEYTSPLARRAVVTTLTEVEPPAPGPGPGEAAK